MRQPKNATRANLSNQKTNKKYDAYAADAYHSLLRNAMAACGYWQAFRAVRKSVERVLRGGNPGAIAEENHKTWYRELFAPSVTTGLLRPADLAGYRNGQAWPRR